MYFLTYKRLIEGMELISCLYLIFILSDAVSDDSRERLQQLLQTSEKYDPNTVLILIQGSELWREQVSSISSLVSNQIFITILLAPNVLWFGIRIL